MEAEREVVSDSEGFRLQAARTQRTAYINARGLELGGAVFKVQVWNTCGKCNEEESAMQRWFMANAVGLQVPREAFGLSEGTG